jgi:hypothetical protein
MHVEQTRRFPDSLQDQFDIHQVISDASFNYFSRIGEVLRQIRISGPLAVSKILAGFQAANQPSYHLV